MSAAVSTASTPFAFLAASVFTDFDARMRVRRAHEYRIGLVRQLRIVGKAAEPAHQRVVLDAGRTLGAGRAGR